MQIPGTLSAEVEDFDSLTSSGKLDDDGMSFSVELINEEAEQQALRQELDEASSGSDSFSKSFAHTLATPDTLEELLDAPRPGSPETKVKGDGFDLDALMEESMDQINASAAVKLGRKKLKDTRISNKERIEIEETIRKWELAREWKPAATAAMFQTQYCNHCGSIHSVFAGIFQRQVHRSSKIVRWVLTSAAVDEALPKEVKHSDKTTVMCVSCVQGMGFQLTGDTGNV